MDGDSGGISVRDLIQSSVGVFLGVIVGMLLGFLTKVTFARLFSQEAYGVFSFGVALVGIVSSIATIGLHQGVAQRLSADKTTDTQNSYVFWSLSLSITFSTIILVLIIFFTSLSYGDYIVGSSVEVIILSLSIPFQATIFILSGINRGFGISKWKIIFEDVGRNAVFLSLLIFIYVLGGFPIWGLASYTISMAIISILYMAVTINKFNFCGNAFAVKDVGIAKDLLIFSIPLMLVTILNKVVTWTDLLMLGYFSDAMNVGIYNSARPLAAFLAGALAAVLFLFMPMATELINEGDSSRVGIIYYRISKWIGIITFPLVYLLFVFPIPILTVLFGPQYDSAAFALQILTIGYYLNNILGPNGAVLTAAGQTRTLALATAFAAIINILLNIVLIPLLGIGGAAIATVSSLISTNVLRLLLASRIIGLKLLRIELASYNIVFAMLLFCGSIIIDMKSSTSLSIVTLVVSGTFYLTIVILSFSEGDKDLLREASSMIGLDDFK